MTGPETAARPCTVCGDPVAARPRGRPGVYCSRACQAKAYRARKSGSAPPAPAAPPVAGPGAGITAGALPVPPGITERAIADRLGGPRFVARRGVSPAARAAAEVTEAVWLIAARIKAGRQDQTADLLAFAADRLEVLAAAARPAGRGEDTVTQSGTETGEAGGSGLWLYRPISPAVVSRLLKSAGLHRQTDPLDERPGFKVRADSETACQVTLDGVAAGFVTTTLTSAGYQVTDAPRRGALPALRVRRTSPATAAETAMLQQITDGQVLALKASFVQPDGTPFTPAEHEAARALLFGGAARLTGNGRNSAIAHPLVPHRDENQEAVTETGTAGQQTQTTPVTGDAPPAANSSAGKDIDRDELFDALEDLEDLVGLDRTGLPAELAEALTLPIVALASALAGASGDGPVDELVAAGRDVVDTVADYRQMPAAAGLVRLIDRLAAALPAPATGRDENRERDENLAHRPAAPGQSAPAEPAPAVDDDTAAYDREQAEQRRRFEAALKPVPEVGAGVLMAEWPGSGRYYLVEATTGERIGYAEKKAYSSVWEARTMRGSKVPATTTYKTRREALVQVALHHQETTQQTRRTRRTRSR